MKYHRPAGETRWMNGLWGADAKGFAAAEDPTLTEAANPYKMYEHRGFWLEGFRRRRATMAAPAPTHEPDFD